MTSVTQKIRSLLFKVVHYDALHTQQVLGFLHFFPIFCALVSFVNREKNVHGFESLDTCYNISTIAQFLNLQLVIALKTLCFTQILKFQHLYY